MSERIMIGPVRLSYVHLVEPSAPQGGGAEKYSCTLLIPKSQPELKAKIDKGIKDCYEEAVVNKFKGARPQMRNALIYDGDGIRPNGTLFGAECKGHWVITASSLQKPGVVHIANIRQELPPQDIYSGMWAYVTINFYSPKQGNPVACGLGNVCKVRDDEPLSGGASAASDFASIGETGPAPGDDFSGVQMGGGINPITGLPM